MCLWSLFYIPSLMISVSLSALVNLQCKAPVWNGRFLMESCLLMKLMLSSPWIQLPEAISLTTLLSMMPTFLVIPFAIVVVYFLSTMRHRRVKRWQMVLQRVMHQITPQMLSLPLNPLLSGLFHLIYFSLGIWLNPNFFSSSQIRF